MAPGTSMNPSHGSANASAGRRGAWISTGMRDGTQNPLWTPTQPRVGDAEQKHTSLSDSERRPRTASWKLRWLAVLIAILGAIVALTVVSTGGD